MDFLNHSLQVGIYESEVIDHEFVSQLQETNLMKRTS